MQKKSECILSKNYEQTATSLIISNDIKKKFHFLFMTIYFFKIKFLQFPNLVLSLRKGGSIIFWVFFQNERLFTPHFFFFKDTFFEIRFRIIEKNLITIKKKSIITKNIQIIQFYTVKLKNTVSRKSCVI